MCSNMFICENVFNIYAYLYIKVKNKYKYKFFNKNICMQQIFVLPLQHQT